MVVGPWPRDRNQVKFAGFGGPPRPPFKGAPTKVWRVQEMRLLRLRLPTLGVGALARAGSAAGGSDELRCECQSELADSPDDPLYGPTMEPVTG
jgi:hypothetical protein